MTAATGAQVGPEGLAPWLQPGTIKLGVKAAVLNLTTGLPSQGGSCPGASTWCTGHEGESKFTGHCYASERRVQGWNKRPVVKEARARNLRRLLAPGGLDAFVREVGDELPSWRSRTVRIHMAGDFFSPAYVDAWHQVAKAHPDFAIFGYTHSWRIPTIRPALERLRQLPNVQLFASTDPSVTQEPPEGWRVASIAGQGIPGFVCPLSKVPLNRRKGVVPSAIVDGRRVPRSCLECRFCIDEPEGGRFHSNVVFNPH